MLHDGVVPVTDTRVLADRLHEKLEAMKGERGTGKKRKAEEVEDDEDLKYHLFFLVFSISFLFFFFSSLPIFALWHA